MDQEQCETHIVYVVDIFPKKDDSLLTTYVIKHMDLQDLQKMFGVSQDNPMYDCFPVARHHVAALEQATGQSLDLDNYDCFVHGYSVSKEE